LPQGPRMRKGKREVGDAKGNKIWSGRLWSPGGEVVGKGKS